jgi:hypothetical protein
MDDGAAIRLADGGIKPAVSGVFDEPAPDHCAYSVISPVTSVEAVNALPEPFLFEFHP